VSVTAYYIAQSDFARLLEELGGQYEVYMPVRKGGQRFYRRGADITPDTVIGEVRPVEPLKAFFLNAREKVTESFSDAAPSPERKPACIVGAKACDLKGFKVQDFVFRSADLQDPFYVRAREQNLIIAADCTCAISTCFCLALDVRPYPEENFDLGLAEIRGGYVVETGSDRGRAITDQHSALFRSATQEQVDARNAQRARVKGEVEKNLAVNGVPMQNHFSGIIERSTDALWAEESKTCVECGACNTICPTCHCFYLYDQGDAQRMARFRMWDSCLIRDFARVAGGANPRPKLWMRLRNRFEKKFDFFPKVSDVYACTGCGRCVSACPAKIDIRKVLRKLANNAA